MTRRCSVCNSVLIREVGKPDSVPTYCWNCERNYNVDSEPEAEGYSLCGVYIPEEART